MIDFDPYQIVESSKRHEHRLEDISRAQENRRHARQIAGRSLRRLWMGLGFVVVVVTVDAVFLMAGHSDAT